MSCYQRDLLQVPILLKVTVVEYEKIRVIQDLLHNSDFDN